MKRILSLILLLILILTGCSGGGKGNIFVRATAEPEGIDLAKISYNQSFDIAANIYTGIYDVTDSGEIVLSGADSVTQSDDGLTYTVKLKKV